MTVNPAYPALYYSSTSTKQTNIFYDDWIGCMHHLEITDTSE